MTLGDHYGRMSRADVSGRPIYAAPYGRSGSRVTVGVFGIADVGPSFGRLRVSPRTAGHMQPPGPLMLGPL